jgi:glycosyltransferase involved in cell wall biosynthesis
MKLCGNVCIRNGNELDFCWRECIQSLLPVCDMVSVSDGESTDGTQEEIREWMTREPKIVLNVYPWPDPKGHPDWWVEWINYNRVHCRGDWEFQLDADEILHEKSCDSIRRFIEENKRRSAIVTRWNFWRDHRHLIPEGECLGKHVIRLAPLDVWMPSDGFHPNGNEAAMMSKKTDIEIYHYGFIRKRGPFFKKERLLQGYFFNSYDERLVKAAQRDGNWMDDPGVTAYASHPVPYDGDHPSVIKPWLQERGMT